MNLRGIPCRSKNEMYVVLSVCMCVFSFWKCELSATLLQMSENVTSFCILHQAENYDQENVAIFLYYVDVFYALCQNFWSASHASLSFVCSYCSCYTANIFSQAYILTWKDCELCTYFCWFYRCEMRISILNATSFS